MLFSAHICCGLAARTDAVEGCVHVLGHLEDVPLLYERVLGRHVDGQLGAPRPDGGHPVRRPDLALEHGIILQQHRGDPQRPVLCKLQNSQFTIRLYIFSSSQPALVLRYYPN